MSRPLKPPTPEQLAERIRQALGHCPADLVIKNVLIFDVVGPDGKPMMQNGKVVQWGVETSSAAALARLGVTTKTFPDGTIFTVRLYPLRDGRPFGAMAGLLISCGKAVPEGGCTKETGKVLLENNNNDA